MALEEGSKPKSQSQIQKIQTEKVNREVLNCVKRGMRYTQILDIYPHLSHVIRKLMGRRPPRTHSTKCIYIYGPPGTGKSTQVQATLQAIMKQHPQLDFYSKMGGMSKFWDGYDNQPFILIDDPGLFNIKFNEDELHAFKNVISAGAHTVEIKGSHMCFDSKLVIMISNCKPHMFADSAGYAARAVIDRIDGSRAFRPAVYVGNRLDALNLVDVIYQACNRVAKHFYDCCIDIERLYEDLCPVDNWHLPSPVDSISSEEEDFSVN